MADYRRVIPRDLFNEASLLKCYGQLSLLLHERPIEGVEVRHDGGAFEPLQDPADGSLTLWPTVQLIAQGERIALRRPLNSREPWPLYATTDDDEVSVFVPAGDFTQEFRALIAPPEPRFLVFSETTREWALPERAGWTRDRAQAGLYTERRADKAAETMLDGERSEISLFVAGSRDDLEGKAT